MTGILSPALAADLLGEGPPQMPLAGDQPRVGDLDPSGEHKPFSASARRRADLQLLGLYCRSLSAK